MAAWYQDSNARRCNRWKMAVAFGVCCCCEPPNVALHSQNAGAHFAVYLVCVLHRLCHLSHLTNENVNSNRDYSLTFVAILLLHFEDIVFDANAMRTLPQTHCYCSKTRGKLAIFHQLPFHSWCSFPFPKSLSTFTLPTNQTVHSNYSSL